MWFASTIDCIVLFRLQEQGQEWLVTRVILLFWVRSGLLVRTHCNEVVGRLGWFGQLKVCNPSDCGQATSTTTSGGSHCACLPFCLPTIFHSIWCTSTATFPWSRSHLRWHCESAASMMSLFCQIGGLPIALEEQIQTKDLNVRVGQERKGWSLDMLLPFSHI